MEKFMRKFTQLNGKKAKILLEHCLFEKTTISLRGTANH